MPNRIREEECPAPGCKRGIQVAGYCDKHYRRLRAHGSLVLPAKPTIEERFWSKVQKGTGCWEWTAHINPGGYGLFRGEGEGVRAHRFSYTLAKGPIPETQEIDHLCRNRRCVNPDHLEAVPKPVNILRGVGRGAINSRKTHCKAGHPLTGNNVYQNRLPWRVCVTCARERGRKVKNSKHPAAALEAAS